MAGQSARTYSHAPLPSDWPGLPHGVGLGLKREYLPALQASPDNIDFVEIHAENFMEDGRLDVLKDISNIWPISVHGVALSLGGEDPLDQTHLDRLKVLIDTISPACFSEHLAWSQNKGIHFNDLLPIPYNSRSLNHLVLRIDQVQQFLGRRIVLENPASYIRFHSDTMSEADFIAELVHRTSCGLLLDVNNLYVSAQNHGWQTDEWLSHIPLEAIQEIHLAGHEPSLDDDGNRFLLDTHGAEVDDAVWLLFGEILSRVGPCPTLIERDNNIPPLNTLLQEVAHARLLVNSVREKAL